MARRHFPWARLPDEELLKLRLKDLKGRIEGTWLEDCLAELHEELEQRGIAVKPHAWISDEWFSPDTTPGIAIRSTSPIPPDALERRRSSTSRAARSRSA